MTEKIKVQVDRELEDLVPRFLANRRKELPLLREALARADLEVLRGIGHNMKGVGGGYGFDAITDLGMRIENAAKGGDASNIGDYIDEYQDYLERVEVELV